MFTLFPQSKAAVRQSTAVFSLILVFVCLGAANLTAQNLPVYAYFQPAQFEDGDEISIHVKVGNSNQQASFVWGLQLKIPYSLFSIDPFSEIDLDAGGISWFGGDGNYFGNHSIDHENQEITVNLFRSNGTPVGGFGYTASMYGIIVEMEEIYGKQQIQPGEIEVVLMEDLKQNMGINWTFEHGADEIVLHNQGQFEIQEVKLFSLAGQMVVHMRENVTRIATHQLVPQAYIMQVTTEQGSFSEKVLIR